MGRSSLLGASTTHILVKFERYTYVLVLFVPFWGGRGFGWEGPRKGSRLPPYTPPGPSHDALGQGGGRGRAGGRAWVKGEAREAESEVSQTPDRRHLKLHFIFCLVVISSSAL